MSSYDLIQKTFDRLAPEYDKLFGAAENPGFARLRAQNLKLLEEAFPPGAWVLDIGCGTGEEAVSMALKGCRVWGIDLSPVMIEQARARAEAAGVVDRVTFHCLPAHRVGELLGEIPPERLTGAWSSFGVFNLEPNLEGVRDGLSRLMKPSGRLLVWVMNRFSLLDAISQLAHLKPGAMTRRQQDDAVWELPTPDGVIALPVRYFDPEGLTRALKPAFVADRLQPLSMLTPTSAPTGAKDRLGGVLKPFSRVESLLFRSRAGAHVADQFVLTLLRETSELEGRPHGPNWLAN